MPARTASADLLGPAGQTFQIVRPCRALGDSVQRVRHRGQAELAWPALARRLASEKPQHSIRLGDATRSTRENRDDTRAYRSMDSAQRTRLDGDFPHVLSAHPAAEVPAEQHCDGLGGDASCAFHDPVDAFIK